MKAGSVLVKNYSERGRASHVNSGTAIPRDELPVLDAESRVVVTHAQRDSHATPVAGGSPHAPDRAVWLSAGHSGGRVANGASGRDHEDRG